MQTGVVVIGAGKSGLAAARAAAKAGARVLVLEKGPDLPGGVEGVPGCLVTDVLRGDDGHVAGVRAIRGRQEVVVDAGAVVLAAGGVAGLWQADAPLATGDAFALAHRAGAALGDLTDIRVEEGRVWIAGGVQADRHGRTTVPGLLACGAATGGGVGGLAAGEWAASHLALPVRGVVSPPLLDIDDPLPDTFADVKMDRLRRIMGTRLPPDGPKDAETGFRELHALKGEADDFARCRVDAKLHAWKIACEAALLVASSFRNGPSRK